MTLGIDVSKLFSEMIMVCLLLLSLYCNCSDEHKVNAEDRDL